jgi:LPPG:FO 2-phospho-L-lactate transferase
MRRSANSIAVLAGGVGAAKFVRGLVRRIDPSRLTVIVNTGDDETFYGLHVSPDLDTITYTLANLVNRAQGWGREDETFAALDSLARFYGRPWFALGDRDLATHLYRTERMRAGAPLDRITGEIARAFRIRARILPMSNDRVRTFVKLRGRPAMPFQQYFVRGRARGAVERIDLRGLADARPLPAALRAIRTSAAVIIAPSNPFVSIGPIAGLRGMRAAPRATASPPSARSSAAAPSRDPRTKCSAASAWTFRRSASRDFTATSRACSCWTASISPTPPRSSASGCARSSPTPSCRRRRAPPRCRKWSCARLQCRLNDRCARLRSPQSREFRWCRRATISPR